MRRSSRTVTEGETSASPAAAAAAARRFDQQGGARAFEAGARHRLVVGDQDADVGGCDRRPMVRWGAQPCRVDPVFAGRRSGRVSGSWASTHRPREVWPTSIAPLRADGCSRISALDRRFVYGLLPIAGTPLKVLHQVRHPRGDDPAGRDGRADHAGRRVRGDQGRLRPARGRRSEHGAHPGRLPRAGDSSVCRCLGGHWYRSIRRRRGRCPSDCSKEGVASVMEHGIILKTWAEADATPAIELHDDRDHKFLC